MEKRGISVIVVKQASICHWLEVSNRQGNYPFPYLMSLIVYEVNILKGSHVGIGGVQGGVHPSGTLIYSPPSGLQKHLTI